MFSAIPDVFDFVTLRCPKQTKPWAEESGKECLLGNLGEIKKKMGFSVAGYVVLDDHAHFLLGSPMGHSCSTLVDALRTGLFKRCKKKTPMEVVSCQTRDVEHRSVIGTAQLRAHLDFIHYEPVRQGLVERAADYRWSSLPTRVAQGHYQEDWATIAPPAAIARFLR